jgi:hypothetical protein
MLKQRDLYTLAEYHEILSPGDQILLGQTVIQYEVRLYKDTRNLTEIKSYIVTCTQRLILPNPAPYSPSPGQASFINYPALLLNTIGLSDSNNIIKNYQLLNYTPKTLNTSVATTQDNTQSQTNSLSRQYSTGSTTSQTNSFGVSAGLGFFGEAATGDLSVNYEQSNTAEKSKSLTTGNAVDHGNQVSNSSSLTVKDWGSYASVDKANKTVTWMWGQEYPWNVMLFKSMNENGDAILLPEFVAARLFDGTVLYPPSELSLFGVDFVSHASWLLTPIEGIAGPEEIAFQHTLVYGSASHELVSVDSVNQVKATLKADPNEAIIQKSSVLDLPLLALDPLQDLDSNSAVIGFVANQFDVAPDTKGSPFVISDDDNTLLVRGSGFNSVMGTDFSKGPVTMTLYFKLTESSPNVSLSLKHWTENSAIVELSIAVNDNAPLTKFVDAPEAGSGGDNVMVIALRNKKFSSLDYCDYLKMGLNIVSITFTPTGDKETTNYRIMAAAIG